MRYRDQPWEFANCRGTDNASWFPERVTFTHLQFLQRICDVCEIQQKCLAWATEREERGFWGGQYFPERMEKDDVDDVEELHTSGDGDEVPDVWEGGSAEMCSEDW